MDSRIAKALLVIEQETETALTARSLAEAVGLSEFHFNRLFRVETGTTAAAYIRVHRLQLAAIRLDCMGESLERVARITGYDSYAAFTRAFTRHYGVPPLRYRRGDRNPAADRSGTWAVADDDRRPVRIVMQPAIGFVRRRYLGPYARFSEHWAHFVASLPEAARGPDARFIGFVHDTPANTAPEAIRYDCGIIDLDGSFAASLGEEDWNSGLVAGRTKPGPHAVLKHHGSYSRIGETYSQLMHHWLNTQERYSFTDDPALEFYRDPLVQIERPEALRIEIVAPLMGRVT